MALPGRGDGRLWVPTHLAIVLGLILMLVILYGLAGPGGGSIPAGWDG